MALYPKRKTFVKRKPWSRRRRVYARKSRRMVMDSLNVKRRCFAGQITPNTATVNGFWNYVTTSLGSAGTMCGSALGGLTNVAEYQALFDTVRINSYTITLEPKYVDYNLDIVTNDTTQLVTRSYVDVIIDPKNNVTPTGTLTSATYNAFCELGTPRRFRGDKKIQFTVKPLCREEFGGGFNRFIKPPFADSSATGIAHRGFHIFHHNQNMATPSIPYDVYIEYNLSFRGKM